MHSDYLVGSRRPPRNLRYGYRARVGGKNCVGLRDAIEIVEDSVFQGAVFARGLDHHRSVPRALELHVEIDAGKNSYLVFSRDRTLFDLPLEVLRDRRASTIERF